MVSGTNRPIGKCALGRIRIARQSTGTGAVAVFLFEHFDKDIECNALMHLVVPGTHAEDGLFDLFVPDYQNVIDLIQLGVSHLLVDRFIGCVAFGAKPFPIQKLFPTQRVFVMAFRDGN